MKQLSKLAILFHSYDKARADAKEAAKEQAELSTEIKEILGETEEAETDDYTCLYKYEKAKDVFDEAKFAEKEPKKYAQYTEFIEEAKVLAKKYTKKVPGARKLIITAKNAQEE